MPVSPQQRRAERHAQPAAAAAPSAAKQPLSVERITSAALEVVAARGYEALTMRSMAALLGTGPASLYAHVVNKADLDELIIGRICNQIVLPEPSAAEWREQITSVCEQLRDHYLAYPGISRAAFAMVVTDLDVLRVNEGMLGILVNANIAPQTAAWAIDALFLYVGAYALEISLAPQLPGHNGEHWAAGHDDIALRFEALPADRFPNTRRWAAELTAGTGHERFDFTLGLMLDSLGHTLDSPAHTLDGGNTNTQKRAAQ